MCNPVEAVDAARHSAINNSVSPTKFQSATDQEYFAVENHAEHMDPRPAVNVVNYGHTTRRNASQRPRALIVEDEIVIALGLEADLSELGFDVRGLAANAKDALSLAMDATPDIAVIDIYLNGARDGIETARMLRELCGVPVVFVTAYSDEEGIVERIERQVPGAPIVNKPLYGHRLADAINEVAKTAGVQRAEQRTASAR